MGRGMDPHAQGRVRRSGLGTIRPAVPVFCPLRRD
jgi:hypothetical protein